MTPQEDVQPAETPKQPEQPPEVPGIRRVRTKKNVGRPRTGEWKKYNASTHYVIRKKHIDDFVYAALLGRLEGYTRVSFISKLQAWFDIPDFYLAQERARQMKIASIERRERNDAKSA